VLDFAAHYPWLIPALPLLACGVIALFGTKLKGLSHIPAIVLLVGSVVLSLTLLAGLSSGALQPIRDLPVFEWFSVGHFHVPVTLTIDSLTALYLSFITGISLLIFIYAAGYMKGDYSYWRFFAYLSLFVFFMTVLVMGSNFLLLYLGWEGVGLASYLLIGYYYPRPAAVAAAKKAFITNRIGDFGLAVGIFLIYTYFGTIQYTGVFAQLHNTQFLATYGPVLKFIPFCLMLGAFGKSAQFPLHVWLPDAMEGPTPVSALIHAATMVTAGIYLIARTLPLFLMDPANHLALDIVAGVGCFTALLAATIALCQYDLKKIWAYSTLSQLGYMFLALGLCTVSNTEPAGAAVFHVFTHAFFKALLFLAAGSVMHAMGGELDIRKMSGIRKVMPITNLAMFIGCLALAGVPPFAGFWSKDEILHAAFAQHNAYATVLGVVGFFVALLTAYYTFRLYFKVFLGPLQLPATAGHHEPSPFALSDAHAYDGAHTAGGIDTLHAKQGHEEASHGEEAHHDTNAHGPSDGSPWMWIPLIILSLGAIGAGFVGSIGGHGELGGWIHWFLGATLNAPVTAANAGVFGVGSPAGENSSALPYQIASTLIAFVGIVIAFYFFKYNRPASDKAGVKFAPLVKFLHNRWYIDEFYTVFLIKPLWALAHILSGIDKFVIDGLVYFVSFIPSIIGYSLKPTQRGILQRYAVGMIAGLAAVVLGVMYLHLLR
jgi:NADH-quinone oxidoreductase subunit L